MGGLSEKLGHKIGPLPAGAWAAAILGGLGISWYLRRRSAASAAANGATDPNATTTDTTSSGGTPIGTSAPDPTTTANSGNVSGPTSPDLAGDPASSLAIETNGQWRQQAVKYVVGARVTTPINAERAIGAYLSGTALASWEVTVVNSALAGIGPTPAPVPPITLQAAPKPAKKAAPKPAPKPKPKPHQHAPVKHPTHPAAHHHPKPHPNARRDTGTNV